MDPYNMPSGPQQLDHIMRQIPQNKSGAAQRALELLIPLGLVAGGAYAGYKGLPKLLDMLTAKTSVVTGKDMQALLGRYNMDLGHYIKRSMDSLGSGKII